MNEYSRSFIPLKQDSPGFSINEKLPVGKCIIEITKNGRAKISVSVSNVKPETVYKVYLISGAAAGSVCAGTLLVDSWGKGDIKWEYDSQTLENGLTMSQIDVVSVIVPKGDSFTAVLTGYRDFEIMWKNNFRPVDTINKIKKMSPIVRVGTIMGEEIAADNDTTDREVYTRKDMPLKNVESTIETVNTIDEEMKSKSPTNGIVDGVYDNIMNAHSSIEDTMEASQLDSGLYGNSVIKTGSAEPENIASDGLESVDRQDQRKPHIHEMFKEMAESIKAGLESIESYTVLSDEELSAFMSGFEDNAINTRGIEYIFEKNLKILPFTRQKEQIEWVKIGIRELIYLPLNFMRIASDPIIACLYRRYRHLILGRQQNGSGEIYYLGVPSAYNEKNALILAQLGFDQFEECEKDEKSRAGYYIMSMVMGGLNNTQ